jgi:futalosine hydrolase
LHLFSQLFRGNFTNMNICIVAATEKELLFFSSYLFPSGITVHCLTHGVGILKSTYYLTKIANKKPDWIIQCGIGGAYDRSLAIGETVFVSKDTLGDTGAEDKADELSIFDMGFIDSDTFPFTNRWLINPNTPELSTLKSVSGITVNQCAGREETIANRVSRFHPQMESMEGASLHFVCLTEGVPFLQIRSVSNHVEARDTSKWNIELALETYRQPICSFIENLILT